MERGIGNKVGDVGVTRWTIGLNSGLRNTFILQTGM